jgi:bla regulator protein BlaR1
MPLLQSLLKDRFHLEYHFETKEMPVYDLVVSKGGAKLTPFDPEQPPTNPQNRGQSVILGVGTTNQIADALARAAGSPVVDKTGIGDGRFGWTLNYTPLSATGDLSNSAAPDLFAAVEQQLGLKLESKKEPLPILVIDHVERVPTEN